MLMSSTVVGEKERPRWLQHGGPLGEVRVPPGAAGTMQEKSRRLLGWAAEAVPALLLCFRGRFTRHPLQRVGP